MKPTNLHKLHEAAHNNWTLHKLLQVLHHGEVLSFEDWAVLAIETLVKENQEYLAKAIDAEKRAPPRPFVMTKEGPTNDH